MEKDSKLAIVGAGKWGKNLIREFSGITEIKKILRSNNEDTAKWLEENYPSIEIAETYEDILNDKDISAIVIATPIESHYTLAKKALLANKDIFVEKPITTSFEEADDLIKIAKEKNLIIFVGYIFLYSQVFNKLLDLLEGETIEHIETTWDKFGTFNENIFWNLLSHQISIAYGLLNSKPLTVSVTSKEGIENKCDIVSGDIEFDTITTKFTLNRVSKDKKRIVYINTGSDHYVWEDEKLYTHNTETNVRSLIFEATDSSLKNECKAFLDSITSRKQPVTNADFSLEITKAIESIGSTD